MIANLDWFDLQKYLQPISDQELIYHIYIRSKLWKKGKFNGNKFNYELFCFLVSSVASDQNLLNNLRNAYSANFANSIKKDFELFRSPDKPISVLSINEATKRAKEYCDAIDLAFPKETDSLTPNPFKTAFEDYVFGESFFIMPHLVHSDEDILKAVKQYLKETRAKNKLKEINKNNAKKILSEIRDLRLLALFDLLYWKAIKDKNLTYTKIGTLIWPEDYIDIEQRIRKKGKPLLEATFDRHVVLELHHHTNHS